jgi:hypothetical protein
MQLTPELTAAVESQRRVVEELSEVLGRYRQEGQSVEEANGLLDYGLAERYLTASKIVGVFIRAGLEQDPDDRDAAQRLLAAITIDAKVAEQAALLSMIHEPLDPEAKLALQELAGSELVVLDLGEELAEFAAPLLDEIASESGGEEPSQEGGGSGGGPAPGDPGSATGVRLGKWPEIEEASQQTVEAGGEVEAGSWAFGMPSPGLVMSNPDLPGSLASGSSATTAFSRGIFGRKGVGAVLTSAAGVVVPGTPVGGPVPAPPTIRPFVENIVGLGAKDIWGTAGAAVPFVGHLLAQPWHAGLAAVSHSQLDAALHIRRFWHALRRLTLKACREVMDKLGSWSSLIDSAGGWVSAQVPAIFNSLAGHGIADLLWRVLDGDRVVAAGDGRLAVAPGNIKFCQQVVDHHAKQRRIVWLVNKALPVLVGCHVVAGASVAAVLLILSVWMAHDHIDSPVLRTIRIPGNHGLLTAIGA